MAGPYKRIPIDIIPGTHPALGSAQDDAALLSTTRCIETDKIWFKRVDNQTFIRPIDAWVTYGTQIQMLTTSTETVQLLGAIRSVSWHVVNGTRWAIVGTSRKLYAFSDTPNNTHYDITPLRTSSDSIANSIATTNGSSTITVTFASHGLSVNDYVQISGAADTGGILAAQLNRTFRVVTVPTANTFTVSAGGSATSTVASGGGAGAIIYRQIAAGNVNYLAGDGYPRIWSYDTFGNVLVLTAGDNSAIYEWDGGVSGPSDIPSPVTNAPTCNWLFVSNNAIVALGANGQNNRIKACGIGDRNDWTPGPGSTSWSDDVEGVGRFTGQAKSRGINLLFTENEVLTFAYAGLPDLWDYETLMTSDGLIGAKAVTAIDDVVYWMGTQNFYYFDGSSVDVIPGNTCLRLFKEFSAAGGAGRSWFARPLPDKQQVWFHFGSDANNEPGQYLIHDYEPGQQHWTYGNLARTAAENPARAMTISGDTATPYLSAYGYSDTVAGSLYYDNSFSGTYSTENVNFRNSYFKTSYRSLNEGNNIGELLELSIDMPTSVTLQVTVNTDNLGDGGGQTASTVSSNFASTPALLDAAGRYWSYTVLKDQSTFSRFLIGKMVEKVMEGYPL